MLAANAALAVFRSNSIDLLPSDQNRVPDVFVSTVVTGNIERASVAASGAEANDLSGAPAISADGRFVAFISYASNLVASDNNGECDVFRRDLVDGITIRVSVGLVDKEANDSSFGPSLSGDGRVVAFWSDASNLVASDSNGLPDVFARDCERDETTLVSVNNSGDKANGGSLTPLVSVDGHYVVFSSYASNLVPDDSNDAADVFVRDLVECRTERVSVDSVGAEANGPSGRAAISGDGRFVAFSSMASNLDLDTRDSNEFAGVFLHDRLTGETICVSRSLDGGASNGESNSPSICESGAYVVFTSEASDLVENDLNGRRDAFIYARESRALARLSLPQDDIAIDRATISGDGAWIGFETRSGNLWPDDTNGTSDVFLVANPLHRDSGDGDPQEGGFPPAPGEAGGER